jgi:hypothetical protein
MANYPEDIGALVHEVYHVTARSFAISREGRGDGAYFQSYLFREAWLRLNKKPQKPTMKSGLYANINAKQKRIAAGSGEKMRKPGSAGAPTAKAFKQSAKTSQDPPIT